MRSAAIGAGAATISSSKAGATASRPVTQQRAQPAPGRPVAAAAASSAAMARRATQPRPDGRQAGPARRAVFLSQRSAAHEMPSADPEATASGNARALRPGPTRPGPTRPGPTRPGPTRPGPTRPGPTRPGPTRPGPTRPGPTRPGPMLPALTPADPPPTTPPCVSPP